MAAKITCEYCENRSNILLDVYGDEVASYEHPSCARRVNYGAMLERERIIALLDKHTGYGDEEWDENVIAIVALIKGEQK